MEQTTDQKKRGAIEARHIIGSAALHLDTVHALRRAILDGRQGRGRADVFTNRGVYSAEEFGLRYKERSRTKLVASSIVISTGGSTDLGMALSAPRNLRIQRSTSAMSGGTPARGVQI